jgi:reactive intermediate/imine deaminase|tara:strand:+ start:423 stop:821 length:399 start_codon:yes stop_codon:yes gene_type:complete
MSTRKKIETKKAPKAIGPYSQAIAMGNIVYLSGQIPLDPNTMELVQGEEEQIRQVFANLAAVCNAANSTLNDIVKLNVYLQDLSIYPKVNEIMLTLFKEPFPARAAVEVSKLPLDALIEIEGVIIKDSTYSF